MRLDKALRLEKMYKEQIRNFWNNCARFEWNEDMVHEYNKAWASDPEYMKLPRTSKEYLRGYSDALYDQHWKILVFTYLLGGKRMSIEDKEYKKVPAFEVHKHHAHTGAWAYRSNLNKLFGKTKEQTSN